MVVIRKDLLERSNDQLPGYLNFKNHAKEDSMWNTPPTFAVYVLGLVTEWLESTVGGLDAMYEINKKKAALVYDVVDQFPNLYTGHAKKSDRSLMNVTFKLPNDEIESAFLKQAQSNNLIRSRGIEALAAFEPVFTTQCPWRVHKHSPPLCPTLPKRTVSLPGTGMF